MITFILNDTEIRTALPYGTPLLNVIRCEQKLKGTKLACGEGECGACTVLEGALASEGIRYHAITSCIAPVASAHGKHIVTIEGLRMSVQGPVHNAMIECNGTQCGFCTPGFIVSITGGLLSRTVTSAEKLITAMDGNICRCTGYKSIQRAAAQIAQEYNSAASNHTLESLIDMHIVPAYFKTIEDRLRRIGNENSRDTESSSGVNIGGGTDLYVQKPYEMRKAPLRTMASKDELQGISIFNKTCSIGAGETMSSLQYSQMIRQIIPDTETYLAPIGSTQIRNMATIGGNLVNASPIGDLTIMFLGLDADIVLEESTIERKIKLRKFYLGYKTLDKATDAIVRRIEFVIPPVRSGFHFERVCKRTYLDVASVNSACTLECDASSVIRTVHLSAGGVAPIPLYLTHTTDFLRDKEISPQLILEAEYVMQDEVSPINDIRGSAEYKRMLLRQQLFVHLTKLSPVQISIQELIRA